MAVVVNSFLLVAVSEMGDKTQLLALVLATRFKKPWAIMAGILAATLVNHGLASWSGSWLSEHVTPGLLKYGLAAIFFIFAAWLLVPDKDSDDEPANRLGAFVTTTITFFLAEMGDKTQLATVALGARYQNALLVTLGTTAGMLFSDGLAVFLGDHFAEKVSMTWLRRIAALLFALFGASILFGF